MTRKQEIIKVREWILHIGLISKVIPFKLFSDIVPSSSADITRALRGYFHGGSVYVSLRIISKERKTSNAVEMSSLIFWLRAKELRFSVCFNTFRNFNRSLREERRISPAQTITTEWTAEKCLDFREQSKQTPKHKLGNRTNRWSADARYASSKKQAKSSLSSNATTPKTTSIKKRRNI